VALVGGCRKVRVHTFPGKQHGGPPCGCPYNPTACTAAAATTCTNASSRTVHTMEAQSTSNLVGSYVTMNEVAVAATQAAAC
jgi:hypothetical protein